MKEHHSAFRPLRLLKYLFKKPLTIPMKDIFDEPREVADNFRGYHTNDWEDCIGCSTCRDICPTEAIIMADRDELEESDGNFAKRPTIDYGRCCFCALCVDICTTGSLKMSKHYLHNSPDGDDYYLMPQETFLGKTVKEGYVKTDESDLLELERVPMMHLSPDERYNNFLEIIKGYSKEQAIHEAARCVECGVCTKTCPANMNIPEYIRAIWEDDFEAGVEYVYRTNPLPGVCGRICTHNCETACSLTQRGEAIAIRWLKRYIVDNAPKDVYESIVLEQVSEQLNGKIAVIGAGPAGLSAAYYLRTIGYQVDVYEQMPLPGGVMRYGIPKYRLPDEAIDQDIAFIEKTGVNIKCSTKVDANMLKSFQNEYDAVFTGSGFFGSRKIQIPGYDHKNVIAAMDFLPEARDFNRGVVNDLNVDEDVIIIGGGNVAFDVSRTVARYQNGTYGTSNVTMVAVETEDILPADLEEIEEGREEGVKYNWGYGPKRIVIEDDKITGLMVQKVSSVFDSEGNFNPSYEGDEILIPGSQVFMAIGQTPIYDYLDEHEENITINRGKLIVNDYGQVDGVPWLFAGGDIVQGPDVITGVADGHRAAIGIDEYLSNKN